MFTPGQKLYDVLVKPIEGDLKGAEAKTLLWWPSGTLRYVPMAALWDGKQYLAERFTNVLTARSSYQARVERAGDGRIEFTVSGGDPAAARGPTYVEAEYLGPLPK